MPPKGSKKLAVAKSNGKNKQVEELAATNVKKIPRSGRLQKMAENEMQEVEPVLDNEAIDAAPKKENGADKEVSSENKPDVSEKNGKVEELEETTSVSAKRGNKKGVKKLPDAKSNGKSDQIEELAVTNVKKIPRGRLHKMTEDEEMQDAKPVLDDEAIDAAPKEENETDKEVATENNPDVSEENGKVEELKETTSVPTKRGYKKIKAQTSAQNKNAKTNEISSDEVTSTEVSDKGVESGNLATAEPEKISGKRGRKKAVDPISANQDQAEEINANQDVEAVAGPSKRSKMIKQDAAAKELVADIKDEDDGDFAPRKTRGGRNAKDNAKEVAPVARGRKRKVIDEKVKIKGTKKGKIVEEAVETCDTEMQVDENRQLRVDIQRNTKLDEMARNSSKEAEEIEGDIKGAKGDSKLKDAKGDEKSKPGRKRANKNAEDAKPNKAHKVEAAEGKSAAKKEVEAPDTTSYDFENSSKSPDGKPWNFKIVSWNINGIRAWLEKDGLNYLHVEQPDVLCLQETKCSEAKLPSELGEIEGYHGHWLAADKDGYSGVGILYKKKPISIKNGIGIEEHDNEGRVVTAEYENFYLVTTYVPNAARGLTRLDYRMKWDNDFRAYIKQLDETKPVILCGDLNVAHEEIDIANPKNNKKNAGFTKEERDGFSALLNEGFVDTFRHLYPDTKDAYTFWTYMMNARAKNVGWRIDYFVISKRFTDHLCDCAIRKHVFGSDHCPIVLFLHV